MLSDNIVSIPFGIIVGLLASCVQSLGLTVQRKSHVQNQSLPENLQRVEHRRPLWLLGFAIFLSSNILGSLIQIASLPVVILAPLGAVSLLWNAFFARLLLGDLFSPWMVLGTIFIAGGAILIAVFGIVPEQTRSLEDLLELFTRPTFIVYFSILGFVTIVCLAATHAAEFSLARRIAQTCPSDASSIDLSATVNVNLPTHTANVTSGLTEEVNDVTLATERTALLDRKSTTPPLYTTTSKQAVDPALISINRTRLLLAISYASFSGIISGMCLLFAKSGVELLLLTLRGKPQFWRWEAWCLVLGLIIFALLQLLYLHKALILADPTLVCPSAFCFYNLSSIVNGLVYFDQFELIPPLHLALVSLGIAVLLGGVWVVSIQSGGGGVDVGTWDEEIVDLNDEADSSCSSPGELVAPETLSLTPHPPSNQITQRVEPVAMERETRSESSIPNIPSEAAGLIQSIDHGVEDGLTEGRHTRPSLSLDKRPRRAETQLYPTPRMPSLRSRRRLTSDQQFRISSSSSQMSLGLGQSQSIARAASQTQSPTNHQQNSFFSSNSHGTLSPPLGQGFQIGLSPLSPGFVIVPLDRRRPSAHGGNVVDLAGDATLGAGGGGSRRRIREAQRRRTVSEGEVSRRNRELMQGEDIEAARDGSEVAQDQGTSSSTAGGLNAHEGGAGRDKTRWRWLRWMIPGISGTAGK